MLSNMEKSGEKFCWWDDVIPNYYLCGHGNVDITVIPPEPQGLRQELFSKARGKCHIRGEKETDSGETTVSNIMLHISEPPLNSG